jgi:CO/xanthine dehydrogenase Mo-binding subunit
VENRDGIGPYGAKGIGDGPTSVMCAAISNALFQAAGVRLYEAPFTPERVWRALQVKSAADRKQP